MPVIDYLDIANKRIYLLSGVRQYHPIDDIYREIRTIRRTNEAMRVMDMPIEASGNVAKGGGKFTARLAIFKYGWRVVPANESHTLKVTGEQITDDGQSGSAILDMTLSDPGVSIVVEYYPPDTELIKLVEYVNVVTASTPEEIWSHVIEGLSAEEMMRVMLAALAGKREGLGTETEHYMAQDGVTPRITLTPDANGNGTPILDGSA